MVPVSRCGRRGGNRSAGVEFDSAGGTAILIADEAMLFGGVEGEEEASDLCSDGVDRAGRNMEMHYAACSHGGVDVLAAAGDGEVVHGTAGEFEVDDGVGEGELSCDPCWDLDTKGFVPIAGSRAEGR